MLIEEPEHPYLDLELKSRHWNNSAPWRCAIVSPWDLKACAQDHDPSQPPARWSMRRRLSKPFTAARDGFSLNAALGCEVRERGKLERVCRYVARPPMGLSSA